MVIQGYGLTETAPIVSLNHPFSARRGSVGKAIAGVEVKIAPDGEILVSGENVTKGYFGAAQATAEAFADGWFHTGDIGEIDAQGRLYISGRKKEMIVTPEGLNVFPEDVERAVAGVPGVRDVAVVGARAGEQERVHAVVVPDPGATAGDRAAGEPAPARSSEDPRRLRVAGRELPRTEGTRKLKRREIREWVATGAAADGPRRLAQSVAALVARFAGGRAVGPGTTIDELGLSSLERVELMVALEERFGTTIDEAAFGGRAGRPDALVRAPVRRRRKQRAVDFPRGTARGRCARSAASACRPGFCRWRASSRGFGSKGSEHLARLEGPVIFAANHQSHIDTPAILWALPAGWRYRVAVAMAKEFFKAHFFPPDHPRARG